MALMLIAATYYLRVLVHQVILRPQFGYDNVRITPKIKQNLLVIASVIYHLVMRLFEDLKIQSGNQNHLLFYERVVPGFPLLAGISNFPTSLQLSQ